MARSRLTLKPDEAQPTPPAPVNQAVEKPDVPAAVQQRVEEFNQERESVRPKRKYSPRRKKDADAVDAEQQQRTERVEGLKRDYSVLGELAIEIVCKRMPNPLPATPDEKEMFGRVIGNLIAKHSDKLNEWGEETAAILAAVVILAPRMVKEKPAVVQEPLPFAPPSDIP